MTQDKDPSNSLTSPTENAKIIAQPTDSSDVMNVILDHPTTKRVLDIAEKSITDQHKLQIQKNNTNQYEAVTRRKFVRANSIRGMTVVLLTFTFLAYVSWFDKSVYWGFVTITPLLIPTINKIVDIFINKIFINKK